MVLSSSETKTQREQLVAAIRVVPDGGSLFAPSVTRRLIERFAELDQLTPREREVLRCRRANRCEEGE